ncbi:hypothetical protein EVAR_24581_1 [Eumeta japonica]|uniref:DDE Tnp4 domain-containing protein n=1 Tax=Eumeta variegata TaxID=151549 RepID=A0A4C1W7M2_EUMVA|nr:hypothetical protein EVAR_24581_1 [Eumeta japonica]
MAERLLNVYVYGTTVQISHGSRRAAPKSDEYLPNDMENYMEYHVMGSVSQVRMKTGCMPTKFTCQPDRKTQTSNRTERPYVVKKRRMMILEECEKQFEESTIVKEPSSSKEIASCSSVQQIVEEVPQLPPRMLDKAIQVHICKTFRSKANQTKVNLVNQMTSPLKPCLHSVSTSPFKIKHDVNSNPSRPSINVLSKIVKQIEQSDSDTSYTHSDEQSSSIKSLQMESTSDCSEMLEDDKRRDDLKALECTLKKIKKSPRSYIGIPLNCYYLVNLIQEQTDRGFKHVEVYLRKMGVLLVRPPSVVSGAKLTKSEAKETKQIASLRIHVERVIRRLREFNMLKPHACLNLSLVKVLDDVITIACGLINIQDSLIK